MAKAKNTLEIPFIYDENTLKYIVSRIRDDYGEYDFNTGSDKFLVISIVSGEATLRKLQIGRLNPNIAHSIAKELDK